MKKETPNFNPLCSPELREALRITLKDGKQGLNDAGEDCDMKSIFNKVDEFIGKYKSSENKYLKFRTL
ncbi:MAG: hypothetical protein SRB1_01691 [Desulfobacteraceae bacterium Eth-SRB1]|nr:MAG: hypothetical protein SRB1_01691 [Desulfobacteraceae bacterium Eth-SRB1]